MTKYYAEVKVSNLRGQSAKAWWLDLEEPLRITLWVPKSVTKLDMGEGKAEIHREALVRSILSAQDYMVSIHGEHAVGELLTQRDAEKLAGFKHCKSSNCGNPVEPGKHKHCVVCYEKRKARQAKTAMQPKCSCGSVISMTLQQEGKRHCSRCLKNLGLYDETDGNGSDHPR